MHFSVPTSIAGNLLRAGRVGAAILVAAMMMLGSAGWIRQAQAANQSIQGASKKEEGGYETDAPMAILIEAESGSILFEKHADQLASPSSMMKLMTAEVVFDALKSGRIKNTDNYVVSENAWRKGGAPSGGSTMFAALKSRVGVDDLLRGLAIHSANDACIILAEGIAGSEPAFVELLTKRARELGLRQATFGNSSGLPDPANKMTVRELSALARHIVRDRGEFYSLFGEREFTWNRIRQTNRNPLLGVMPGADGLKTGYTKEGGYGMVASAVQDGLRLIAVVNGVGDSDDRLSETRKLLEWGFKNFEIRTVFAPDQVIGYAKVFGGAATSVALKSVGPVKVMTHRNGNDRLIARIVYAGPVRAPFEKGRQTGTVKIWRGPIIVREAPLYASESVAVGSMSRRAIDGMTELAVGLFRSGADKVLSKSP